MWGMRFEELTSWWHYVNINGCEDQTKTNIAIQKLDTECQHLVPVVHAPGNHDVVAREIPGFEFSLSSNLSIIWQYPPTIANCYSSLYFQVVFGTFFSVLQNSANLPHMGSLKPSTSRVFNASLDWHVEINYCWAIFSGVTAALTVLSSNNSGRLVILSGCMKSISKRIWRTLGRSELYWRTKKKRFKANSLTSIAIGQTCQQYSYWYNKSTAIIYYYNI